MPHTTALPAALRGHRVFGHLPGTVRATLAGQFARQVFSAGALVGAGPALLDRLGWVLAGHLALHPGAETSARSSGHIITAITAITAITDAVTARLQVLAEL